MQMYFSKEYRKQCNIELLVWRDRWLRENNVYIVKLRGQQKKEDNIADKINQARKIRRVGYIVFQLLH